MLSRFIAKSSNFRFLTLISSHSPPHNLQPPIPIPNPNPNPYKIPRFYSTNGGNNDDHRLWNIASGLDDSSDSLLGEELPGAPAGPMETAQKWSLDSGGNVDDLFAEPLATAIPRGPSQKWEPKFVNGDGGGDLFGEVMKEERPAAEKLEKWNLGGEGDVELDLFNVVGLPQQDELEEVRLQNAAARAEEEKMKLLAIEEEKKKKELEIEEKHLSEMLNGPKRAFGDLIAASGITDEMLDTLLALKDFGGIPGLRPLHELEDERYYKNTTKSTKAEMERLKQEEVAKARVQQIDDKGRAYGTGRRKCSIARVWVQPGEGKFVVNDKEFDVYFPMLDHRAVLLRPFSETKTLGKWNVNCTVKGGGVSGQVGAIRLGISRALQNWAPDLRPPLRAAGFLTRDSRVVERKKPGKAKARKSFQWVKR